MLYTVTFESIDTGALADTFKTMLALLMPDTNDGHRARLRKLIVGASQVTPSDDSMLLQIKRILDVSVGSAGTAGTTIGAAAVPKVDPDSIDSFASAKIDYSAEPTTYATEAIYAAPFNTRGGLIERWEPFDPEAPVFRRDQLLGLLIAPRAAAAVAITGSITFETF